MQWVTPKVQLGAQNKRENIKGKKVEWLEE
jgi:hypothetical protein